MIIPAVGKSGPGICSIRSFISIEGLSITARLALITSVRLCGGMFVAIPTAIPDEPLISKFGNLVGITDGSDSDPS